MNEKNKLNTNYLTSIPVAAQRRYHNYRDLHNAAFNHRRRIDFERGSKVDRSITIVPDLYNNDQD